MDIFTHTDKLKPTELATKETTPAENHRDNGASTPHRTQTSSTQSPLTDALVNQYKPPLCPRVNSGNTARLSSMADHPEVRLKAYKDALFGVYQDWVHQNPGNHLDNGINEDGKWKYRVRKLFCLKTERYNVLSG